MFIVKVYLTLRFTASVCYFENLLLSSPVEVLESHPFLKNLSFIFHDLFPFLTI